MGRGGWLPGEDALAGCFDSMREASRSLGRFVTELQGIDMTGAPRPGTEGFVRGLPLAGDSTFRAAVERCEGLVYVDRLAAVWDDALAALEWDGPPVWVHADLIPGNLLVRDGRLAGVIDFGAMATEDPGLRRRRLPPARPGEPTRVPRDHRYGAPGVWLVAW